MSSTLKTVVKCFVVFAIVFVGIGILPLAPLRKGDVVIGRFPLGLAWLGPQIVWTYAVVHLELSIIVAGLVIGVANYIARK
jgi:hypothetical protein